MTNIVSYRPIQTTSITFYTYFVVLTVYLKAGPSATQARRTESLMYFKADF